MDPSMLTGQLATEIAAETSEILGYRVLITDNQGVVIGSAESERLGTMHQPSLEVVATGEPSSKTRAELSDIGVRPGITMPLTIDGATIGTVGIAGPPKTVRQLGRLVQRQTEILLRESLSQRTRVLHEHALAQLVRDITVYDERLVEDRVLAGRAEELGYDLSGERAAIAIESREEDKPLRVATVRAAFAGREDIVSEIASGRCLVLHQLSAARDPGRGIRASLIEHCHAALRTLHGHGHARARIGLGPIGRGIPALSLSCHEAGTALRLGRVCAPTEEVVDIEAFRVQQLLESVPGPARTRFTDSQLAELRACTDYEQLRATVLAWFRSGFNLVRTATLLGIHRNTVVYRLDKITRKTGSDIRTPECALPVFLACLTSQLDRTGG